MSETFRRFATCLILITVAVLAMAVLALATDSAEAGGSGDYPPPSSGNWYITQATSVWSESIVLQANLYIYAPLTLNMVNLTMACSSNVEFEIAVLSTGSLTISDSNVTALDGSYHYRFRTYNTTTIQDSEISEAYYGIQAYTKQFTLKNSKVFDTQYYGVYMSLSYTLTGNVVIQDNEFTGTNYYGVYIYQYASVNRVDYDVVMRGDLTLTGNKFHDNLGGGVYIYRYMYAYYSHQARMYTNLTIEGNEMTRNRGYSVYVYTQLYNYQGADDGVLVYEGAINVNNNTIRDNSGYYTIYYQNAIDIYYGSDALIDSDINMVGNVITNNKDAITVYLNNNIYEYYGRDAKARTDLRIEANNVSNNGGHAFYIYSYTNTDRGDIGVCTNDGDLVFKDNIISDNLGSGVYLYRYAYSSYAAYASITGNTTFEGNNIQNNQGYGGTYLYSYAYKSRGDANGTAAIYGRVRFTNNTYIGNLGYGVYVLRYTRTYYGSTSAIRGDVEFDRNAINKNTGYGAYVYYDAYKDQGGESGTAQIISNASFTGNTMSGNSGYHGFYYYKYARSYYSSYAYLNGTSLVEGNTIEDNKGYGIYIYAYCYNYQGALGNTFISGDIWVRNNLIRRNNGGGVYLYCYSYSYMAKSADIYQNISFNKNTVTNNGASGFVISVNAYSYYPVGGDTHVVGRISYLNNIVNSNQNYGIYFYRYARSYYTDATKVFVTGDMVVEGNQVESNTYYAIYMINYVYNYQAGLTGHCELDSDYIFRNNTVKNNRYWAAMYIYRRVYAYQTGTALLNSDLTMEDNVVTGNWGTGVYILDLCDQYYYGGASDPDRGSFTHKGRMDIMRNRIETNAGTGLHINSTITAVVSTIEAAPRIVDNSISYNGGDFGVYCDLRDITKPITFRNNTMEHNEVQYVAVISNSGTAPDILFEDNRIRYNDVQYTILGLVIGAGTYNATFDDNNVSYNDANQAVLAFISSGQIKVENNNFIGNTNSTDVVLMMGPSNESTMSVASNLLLSNSGNAVNVNTLGKLQVKDNVIRGNTGSGVIATTDLAREVIEADFDIRDNRIVDNGGNGVWSVSMSPLVVEDNVLTGNDMAGIRVNAMKLKPTLKDNTISGNKWGIQLFGDNLAPLTTTYTFQDLTITDSTQEGFYAQDLTVQLRSTTVKDSGEADLAVRNARIDCYSCDVGYASGHVYEEGHIKVWWRIDVDVQWQSGLPVPRAQVTMASDYDNRTYKELETDAKGHIDHFNVEEWSMIDTVVNRWSPFRCTATKNTESSTQVETVDRNRNILIILRDAHVPTVVITEPEEGALLNYSIVRVAGTASDGGSGLKTVRMRIDAEGWTDLGKVPAFAKLMPLPDGAHTITVQAEDLAGMLGNATVNLTVDTQVPKLMIIYPPEGLLTNENLVEVEGRVLEPGLEVTVMDIPQAISSDNSFNENVRLFEGPNKITVWARDRAGNQRWLFRNVTLDTIPPILFVDTPEDRFLTRDPVVTVAGRSEAGAMVHVGSVETTVEADGTFSLEVDLVEGENRLTVSATDAAGNTATVYTRVRLDTQAPSLAIIEPEDGLLTRDSSVRVMGAVGMEDGLVLSVAGSYVLPLGGFFNYTVDLVEGENLIVVTALDEAGNKAEDNVTVIKRTKPPRLEVTRPEHDYMITNQVRYSIEGVTDADVDLRVQGELVPVEANGNFTVEVQLQTGENVIALEAADALGNRAQAVVHLILDTEPPGLVVDSPFDGYVTELPEVNVSGRTDVGAYLTINGMDVPTDDKGQFSYRFGLAMGRQNITVVSTDQAGNEAMVRLFVERFEPEEPFEPMVPTTSGGSTGVVLAALLVLIAVGALGYMLYQKRRREKQEEEG